MADETVVVGADLCTLANALSKPSRVVLTDCLPVLPVTDTLLVSRLVDTMLVLAPAGRTKKQDLGRNVELFDQVQVPILGTIVNCVPQGGAYDYGYGGHGWDKRSATAHGSTAFANGGDVTDPVLTKPNGDGGFADLYSPSTSETNGRRIGLSSSSS